MVYAESLTCEVVWWEFRWWREAAAAGSAAEQRKNCKTKRRFSFFLQSLCPVSSFLIQPLYILALRSLTKPLIDWWCIFRDNLMTARTARTCGATCTVDVKSVNVYVFTWHKASWVITRELILMFINPIGFSSLKPKEHFLQATNSSSQKQKEVSFFQLHTFSSSLVWYQICDIFSFIGQLWLKNIRKKKQIMK